MRCSTRNSSNQTLLAVRKNNLAQKKIDIASIAECDISDVNNLLRSFRSMRDMQGWLKVKKERGDELPTNQAELRIQFRQDKPMNYKDSLRQKNANRWSKKDHNRMRKWTQAAVINKAKHS